MLITLLFTVYNMLIRMEQQLLGYEHTLYRLDQAEHIVEKLDRVAPQILRTRRNSMRRPVEEIMPDLRRAGELEQDVIEERLLRYRRGYIMQVIGGILFPNASDSRVHIRWLPLLEDHDRYGRLSWGLAVLAWLYCQMCRAMKHSQRNLGGCISLLLSWAYLHIPLLWPVGFDTRRFLLVERWVEYRLDNAKGEHRLRHYRRMLNGIGILNLRLKLRRWLYICSFALLSLSGIRLTVRSPAAHFD
ncbi:hypothetical protein Ahy_A04g021048 [Arachis hypogaea]|uniref:Aminotransferase-like plant mobile domain-containing protein n=1 Tax=Arachis hypogaea TaxID=3818 RepID=A0A445DJG3_ARAHY|nr:hypothetical protein Ahy_A04g021048 [Arachis hypogaea]